MFARNLVKPLIYKLLGEDTYVAYQARMKARDIRRGTFAEPEIKVLSQFVNAGDDALDIGANYGHYTCVLSRLVKETGRVFAFEPIPSTFQLLNRVTKLLSLKNAVLINQGVGSAPQRVSFSVPKLSFGAFDSGLAFQSTRKNNIVGANPDVFHSCSQFDCEIVSIDQTVLSDLKQLTFVKMDIEGAEFFALQGMAKTIEKFRPVILIEFCTHFFRGMGIEPREVAAWLRFQDYQFYSLNENSENQFRFNEVPHESPPSNNYFVVPLEKRSKLALET